MNPFTAATHGQAIILMVDDQSLTARLLQRQLTGQGDLVLHAIQDPLQAVGLAETIRPAVILLDLVMPEMDGLTLLMRFREIPAFQEVPIIMLSAVEEAELKAKAFEIGANDYLIKLPDRVEMLARLRYHANAYFNLLETRRAQQAIKENERRFRFVTETVSEAIIAVDTDGNITFWNQGAGSTFGYSHDEIFNQPFTRLVPERQRNSYRRGLDRLFAMKNDDQAGNTVESVGLRKNGTEFPMELSINSWREDGESFFVSVIRDITERKRAEEHIRYQANYDALTDLPNRKFFMQRLGENISLARRRHRLLALMFIDLDKFKWVNDTLGHAAGDQLLQQVAQRLTACIRTSDTLGRLGGDEFTVILYDILSRENAATVADKMLTVLKTPFTLEGETAEISGSIGITLFPDDGPDMETLLRNADMAMYVAKNSGRNAYWFFNPEGIPDGVPPRRTGDPDT